MFEALGTAVDDLEIPADSDALVEVLDIYQRFGAKVVAVIGEFDHTGLWDLDHATSMTAWLKDRRGRSGPEAHRLEPGAVIDTALRVATTNDCPREPARTASEKRADAVVDICRHFLDHQQTRRGGRHRPHINIVINGGDLDGSGPGQFLDGSIIGGGDVGRLLCDGDLHRVLITNKSAILDYGTTIHTAPAPLFAAVAVRDRHCRWPGCDRPAHWCEAHHVWHWTDGGPTRIDNLVLLCSRHHHRLHRPGWHAKLLPDATFEITTPEGNFLTSHPPIRGPSP